MKRTFPIFFRYFCFFLILTVFASCKNEDLIQRGDTLPTAYKKAMGLYQAGEYGDAAEAFETVIQLGRGTDYAREAQFFLAESYFKQERYLLSAAEYERYVSLYPRGTYRQEAQFKEAYSYYELSPRYKLDQSYTRTAIEKFRLYNSRFSDSEKVKEAAMYINRLRSKLAKKLYYSADLYLRTDSFEAAIIYFNLTIDNYPETIWAQRALVDEIQAYNTYASLSVPGKQQERYQKAIETYEKFVQLYPDGKYRSEAEDHVDEARSALADLDGDSSNANTTASAGNAGSQ